MSSPAAEGEGTGWWTDKPLALRKTSKRVDATKAVQEFKAGTGPGKFKLDRATVANRLALLVVDSDLLRQGDINVCGPAAFARVWIPRDPLSFVELAISLFENGYGYVASRRVEPDSDLKNQTWQTAWGCPQADWMVLSSLRDDENWLWDFEGTPAETLAAITLPSEVKEWLDDTRCYTRVRDQGNWTTTKGLDHAKGLKPGPETDVILLINSHVLSQAAVIDGKLKSTDSILNSYPNHFIVLDSPITETSDGKLEFNEWTWGDPSTKITVGKDVFEANYYGAVIAEVSSSP